MLSNYLEQFKWTKPLSQGVKEKHVLWTPRGMTQAEALQELPPVCHKHLMVWPSADMVDWLVHLHQCNIMSEDHAGAERIKRCIVAANCMLAEACLRNDGAWCPVHPLDV